ncbi:MAG: type II CAAX endopeptidase family protein [Candidatus Gracilibacteria bacterium]|jgi:membrane protease YdiL (CAAX protease family)
MKDKKLFFFGILPALFFQVFGATLYLLWESELTGWIYLITKLTLLFWPLLWLTAFTQALPNQTGGAKNSIKLAAGLISGLLFSGIVFGAFFLGLQPAAGDLLERVKAFGLADPWLYLLFAIFLSFFHSLLEEYYWRWFVFRGLQLKFSWVWAALISSAAFTGHHYFVLSGFFSLPLTLLLGTSVGVAGFIWCALYHKTKSIWPAYLSHILVDATLMGVGYLILF